MSEHDTPEWARAIEGRLMARMNAIHEQTIERIGSLRDDITVAMGAPDRVERNDTILLDDLRSLRETVSRLHQRILRIEAWLKMIHHDA